MILNIISLATFSVKEVDQVQPMTMCRRHLFSSTMLLHTHSISMEMLLRGARLSHCWIPLIILLFLYAHFRLIRSIGEFLCPFSLCNHPYCWCWMDQIYRRSLHIRTRCCDQPDAGNAARVYYWYISVRITHTLFHSHNSRLTVGVSLSLQWEIGKILRDWISTTISKSLAAHWWRLTPSSL